MKRIAFLAPLLFAVWPSYAQSPTASPTYFNFSYLVGSAASTFPTGSLKATLPSGSTSSTVCAALAYPTSSPGQWLTITPTSGSSPLAMALAVNPTSLSPGTYTVTIELTGAAAGASCPGSGTPTSVIVTLAVTTPPSSLVVTSPNFDPATSGSTTPSLTYNYTSGTTPSKYELYVSASAGIVPFTVTAATSTKGSNWLLVANTGIPGQQLAPVISTTGVATNAGTVQVEVSLSTAVLQTLDVGTYTGTVTVTATAPATGSYPVAVNLQVSAGPPKLYWIFPSSMPALPSTYTGTNPVVTVGGDNFFKSSSSVFMASNGGVPIPLTTTWVSRQLLTVTLPATYLAPPASGSYPETLEFFVQNGAPPSSPSQGVATSGQLPFFVTDPSTPYVQSIVNAASYLPTAAQTVPALDPVPQGLNSVSPREIVAIFGQNLASSTSSVPAAPLGSPLSYPFAIPPYNGTYVTFQVQPQGGPNGPVLMAPLIMISATQINAIVPYEIQADAAGNAYPAGTPIMITVYNNFSTPFPYLTSLLAAAEVGVPADPGIFTFAGNGQGQAAVLNFNSTTGTASANSTKNPAPAKSAIEIYATGMGDITPGPTITVTDTSVPPQTASLTYPLTVSPALTISPSALPTGQPGSAYLEPDGVSNVMLSVTATVAPVLPYHWSMVGPTWLAVTPQANTALATLTGTPTAAGTFLVTVSVTDSSPTPLAATMTYAVTTSAGMTINTASLDPVTADAVTTVNLSTLGANGNVTWSAQTPPGLPGWMSLDQTTGVLTISPTAADTGTIPVSVQALDSSTPQQSAIATYLLTVNPTITISPNPLPVGVAGASYAPQAGSPAGISLNANGATCAVACTWVDASLPNGSLKFSGASGTTVTLSGKPVNFGTSTVKVTDDNGASAQVTLTINPSGQLTIATPSLTTQVLAISQSQILEAQGGSGVYTWTSSGLPPGLVLSSDGTLSGPPSVALQFPLPDGMVAPAFPIYLKDDTYRVVINGQAADTFYAGTSPFSAAGLTQINAIVPPGASGNLPITVEIGPIVNGNATARRSQAGATIAVK